MCKIFLFHCNNVWTHAPEYFVIIHCLSCYEWNRFLYIFHFFEWVSNYRLCIMMGMYGLLQSFGPIILLRLTPNLILWRRFSIDDVYFLQEFYITLAFVDLVGSSLNWRYTGGFGWKYEHPWWLCPHLTEGGVGLTSLDWLNLIRDRVLVV